MCIYVYVMCIPLIHAGTYRRVFFCDFSQVDLTILVLDVNDNAPVFQRRDYGVTVPEDVAVGTEVLRVLATSVDIGPNAEITYRVRSGNELGKFAIDSNSGEWRSFCGQSTCVKLDSWSDGGDTWQIDNSKREREGLQECSETCYDV